MLHINIENATHKYVNGYDRNDILKVVEQINFILSEKENKPHEDLWKDIKIYIFGNDYGKIV